MNAQSWPSSVGVGALGFDDVLRNIMLIRYPKTESGGYEAKRRFGDSLRRSFQNRKRSYFMDTFNQISGIFPTKD
jgi:hypothetical protein